jgi:hypothetical protein
MAGACGIVLDMKKKKPTAPAASGPFILGREQFEKISAVEGLHLTREMKRDFREFDRENLSGDERRKRLLAKYGKGRA